MKTTMIPSGPRALFENQDNLSIGSVASAHGSRRSTILVNLAFIFIAMILMSSEGFAQTDGSKSTQVPRMIGGLVISAEDHLPLPGVTVSLKGSITGTITDHDGRFEFPKQLVDGDRLLFSLIGMKTVEYTITENDKGLNLNIIMEMEAVVAGEAPMEEPTMAKHSRIGILWRSIKNIF